MWTKSTLPIAPHDGLDVPEVGEWGAEKYLRVWMYDEIFTTSMKGKKERVYVDLFAGAGHARLKDSGRTVLSSAMLALHIPYRFDRYVLCEANPTRMAALRERVRRAAPDANVVFLEGDANRIAQSIVREIPPEALAFCFVDPFGTNIRLNTIRVLAARRIDLLILLALGMDANRNKEIYRSEESTRLDDFLGDPAWRERWAAERNKADLSSGSLRGNTPARCARSATWKDEMHPVKDRGRLLYHLAFFSESELARKFWHEVRKYTNEQAELGL